MKDYLEKMISQEQEALNNAISNNAHEDVIKAIRHRLESFQADLVKENKRSQERP